MQMSFKMSTKEPGTFEANHFCKKESLEMPEISKYTEYSKDKVLSIEAVKI